MIVAEMMEYHTPGKQVRTQPSRCLVQGLKERSRERSRERERGRERSRDRQTDRRAQTDILTHSSLSTITRHNPRPWQAYQNAQFSLAKRTVVRRTPTMSQSLPPHSPVAAAAAAFAATAGPSVSAIPAPTTEAATTEAATTATTKATTATTAENGSGGNSVLPQRTSASGGVHVTVPGSTRVSVRDKLKSMLGHGQQSTPAHRVGRFGLCARPRVRMDDARDRAYQVGHSFVAQRHVALGP